MLEREGGVVNYIQRCRLRESFTMLCDVSSPAIASVAEKLCFTDPSSFSRAFRREFGMRPSDARAAALAGQRPGPSRKLAPGSGTLHFSDCLRG
jgi:AraC-like DNA-binding protein